MQWPGYPRRYPAQLPVCVGVFYFRLYLLSPLPTIANQALRQQPTRKSFLRVLVRWYDFQSAGWRWPLSPTPTLRKGVDVLLARTNEIEEVHPHILAGLADAQKHKILVDGLCGPTPLHNISKPRKGFDCVFCVVVVPRKTVVVEKSEELVAVPFKTLNAL